MENENNAIGTKVLEQVQAAKNVASEVGCLSTKIKNEALLEMARGLISRQEEVLKANTIDMDNARKSGMKPSMLDRLLLTKERIFAMAEGLKKVVNLDDPIGEVEMGKILPNGLQLTKVRVPMGLIGIIYEARPNVTADAIGLCIKSGNCVVLKGGSEAINSNKVISDILLSAGEASGLPKGAIQFINSADRSAVTYLITADKYVDVVIPRGGAGLIQAVVKNSTVPVIETGIGVCHTFVDESANLEKAEDIAFNAKVSRPSVCNAMETLLIHRKIANRFMPKICKRFVDAGVKLFVEQECLKYNDSLQLATSEDWATEYGDLRLSIKLVDDVNEAINHIAKYGTNHSEAIVTENMSNARLFQTKVDAAAVYVNASTRFTDGEEFGFGAEIGISTQKMHARGPMGLRELTSMKYLINGDGQIR
jgi:glutamate-5-semialdehyde dehydrogenase